MPRQRLGPMRRSFSTAFQAAIYGYPLLGMYRRMSEEALDPATRKAPFDAYFHWTELATPEASPFPAPNNDTLYSTAWLDLRKEPSILAMPDTKGRYYTAHIMDMTTETIANIGQRLNGTEEGSFAVVGPGWHGDLPPGIKGVVHCGPRRLCPFARARRWARRRRRSNGPAKAIFDCVAVALSRR